MLCLHALRPQCPPWQLAADRAANAKFPEEGESAPDAAEVRKRELEAKLAREGRRKKEHAARALTNLAVNADNQVAIAAAGAIPPLVALLREGSAEGRAKAAGALGVLALDDDNQWAIIEADAMLPLIKLSQGGCAEGRVNAEGTLGLLAARRG